MVMLQKSLAMCYKRIARFFLTAEGLDLEEMPEIIRLNNERDLSQLEIQVINDSLLYLTNLLEISPTDMQNGGTEQARYYRDLLGKILLENTLLPITLFGAVLGVNNGNITYVKQKIETRTLTERTFRKHYEELLAKLKENPELRNWKHNSHNDTFIKKKFGITENLTKFIEL